MRERGGAATVAFCLLVAPASQAEPVVPRCDTDVRLVPVGPGPEDMEWDAQRSRLLISTALRSSQREPDGRIQALRIPVGETPELIDLKLVDRPVDIGPFSPIGLSLVHKADEDDLYLVAKGNRDFPSAIEKYRVLDDALVFVDRFESLLLTVPNDVLALADDELYVSNATSGTDAQGFVEVAFKQRRSGVVHRRPGCRDRWHVAAPGIAFPNGITLQTAADAKDDRLRVAAFNERRILSFWRDRLSGELEPRLDEAVPLTAHPDNLMTDGQGRLLVASHPNRPKTFLHILGLRSTTPSAVYRIDRGGKVELLFSDKKGKKIAGSSTAVVVDDLLYVSQVRKPFIGICAPSP